MKYRPPGRHLKHRPPPAAASRPAVVRRSATVPSRTRSMHPLALAITGERSALVSCPRRDAPCRPAPPMLSPPHDRRGRRLAGTIVVCCHPSSGPLSVARICYTPWLAPESSAAACQPGLGRMAAATGCSWTSPRPRPPHKFGQCGYVLPVCHTYVADFVLNTTGCCSSMVMPNHT